jgi:hypothetical protein
MTGDRDRDATAGAQLHLAPRRVFDDVAGVGEGTGEPVEFGDDEGVALPARGQGFTQPGSGTVGAGEPVVDENLLTAAEGAERVLLGGEVLFAGGNPAYPMLSAGMLACCEL